MDTIHTYVGWAIPSAFLLLSLWSLVSFLRNRDPHAWFWSLLGFLQVVIGIQFVVGGVLFLMGRRAAPGETLGFLHYFYGAFFPALVLWYTHRRAKTERWKEIPWAAFGIAAFICFGLTARALMTGLGTG